MNQVIVFAFSKKGRELAKRIAAFYPQSSIVDNFKEQSLGERVGTYFMQHNVLIFVGATGIAVRGIAPFIKGKDVDPAVLVVDELGRFVIPLLSGHLGGANSYSENLGSMLEAMPILTTATDMNQAFAVDVWAKKQKLYIHNIDHIKYISSAILEGEKIGLASDYRVDGVPEYVIYGNQEAEKNAIKSGILISESYSAIFPHTLWLEPKKYVLGIGCRKGIDSEKFEKQLLEFLAEQDMPMHLVSTIASIDLKENEEAILSFSRKYGIEFLTFGSEELAEVKGEFTKSAFVQSITGVDNVCERSAICASRAEKLLIRKTIVNGMTIAVCTGIYKTVDWSCR